MAGVLTLTLMSTGPALTSFWTVPKGVTLSAWFFHEGVLPGLGAFYAAGAVLLALRAACFRAATLMRWVGWLTALR